MIIFTCLFKVKINIPLNDGDPMCLCFLLIVRRDCVDPVYLSLPNLGSIRDQKRQSSRSSATDGCHGSRPLEVIASNSCTRERQSIDRPDITGLPEQSPFETFRPDAILNAAANHDHCTESFHAHTPPALNQRLIGYFSELQ